MRPRQRSSERGFSLIEVLVVTALTVIIMAGVFTALDPANGAFQTQPEVADMQQRLRVGVETLQKDLLMAGSGTYSGIKLGTFVNFFAPILPMRAGAVSPDPPGTVRSDAITLYSIGTSVAQTTISTDMPQPSAELKVNRVGGCPQKDPLCGFENEMAVIIFDDTGSWDQFEITNVQSDSLHLQHRGQTLSKPYKTGSYIAQLGIHTYYLYSDPATETYQLRHYNGFQTDVPVVDNVVALNFDYFGESQPPMLKKPLSDPKGPWTTYGPKPPAVGVKDGEYPAGENCVFQVSGGQQVPRLPALETGSNGLVHLTPTLLSDGPWCPGPSSPNRFDADLLRIREIRVTMRVQAPEMLRGPASALTLRGGTARHADRFIPDQQIQFDVTPRNLNLGR